MTKPLLCQCLGLRDNAVVLFSLSWCIPLFAAAVVTVAQLQWGSHCCEAGFQPCCCVAAAQVEGIMATQVVCRTMAFGVGRALAARLDV